MEREKEWMDDSDLPSIDKHSSDLHPRETNSINNCREREPSSPYGEDKKTKRVTEKKIEG